MQQFIIDQENLCDSSRTDRSHFLQTLIKRLISDYWCRQTPVSMLSVTSQCHVDIMMIIAIHYDSPCTSCPFLKTGLVDHLGVLQTPMFSLLKSMSQPDMTTRLKKAVSRLGNLNTFILYG